MVLDFCRPSAHLPPLPAAGPFWIRIADQIWAFGRQAFSARESHIKNGNILIDAFACQDLPELNVNILSMFAIILNHVDQVNVYQSELIITNV